MANSMRMVYPLETINVIFHSYDSCVCFRVILLHNQNIRDKVWPFLIFVFAVIIHMSVYMHMYVYVHVYTYIYIYTSNGLGMAGYCNLNSYTNAI